MWTRVAINATVTDSCLSTRACTPQQFLHSEVAPQCPHGGGHETEGCAMIRKSLSYGYIKLNESLYLWLYHQSLDCSKYVSCDMIVCFSWYVNSHQSHKSHRKYKFENRANTDLQIYQRWDQVPRRSKHPINQTHKQ
jgi:hypothetical protein